jgi:hypothetical protein
MVFAPDPVDERLDGLVRLDRLGSALEFFLLTACKKNNLWGRDQYFY